MDKEQRLNLLKNRIPQEDREGIEDTHFDTLLEIAKGIIFEVRFPYSSYPDDVEEKYHSLQVSIALELFNKEGAEGQKSHSENGISRTYSSGDVSADLIDRIVPICGV